MLCVYCICVTVKLVIERVSIANDMVEASKKEGPTMNHLPSLSFHFTRCFKILTYFTFTL